MTRLTAPVQAETANASTAERALDRLRILGLDQGPQLAVARMRESVAERGPQFILERSLSLGLSLVCLGVGTRAAPGSITTNPPLTSRRWLRARALAIAWHSAVFPESSAVIGDPFRAGATATSPNATLAAYRRPS
jgi:hypothetical protein